MLDITVAISRGHNSEDLDRLLASLACQRGVRYEILVGGPVAPVDVARMRNGLYRRAASPRIYFIDADCELPSSDFLSRLVELTPESENVAYGGFYRTAATASGLQKAYNSSCNLWLKVHFAAGQALPVAGNFIVPKLADAPADFPFVVKADFGGEEVGLSENLRRQGTLFKLRPDLAVTHYPAVSAGNFFGRARLHGTSPRQPLSLRKMFRPALRHLLEEERPVGLLVVGYVAMVWLSRLWGGKWSVS